MTLRPSPFLLSLALLGCAASTRAPTQEPPSGEVAVIDLNEASLPEPKKESKPSDAADPGGQEQAELAGMIGLLNRGDASGAGLSSIFGKDTALGADGEVKGNVLGDPLGEAFGAGGLGLTGSGGGEGLGGLGSIGSLGLGAGSGTGQGYGVGTGVLGKSNAIPPKMTGGAASVSGRLPPEVIQRIVRANFGRFRFCYENGLLTNPGLRGKLQVQFVISPQGMVSSAKLISVNLPDSAVSECVVRAFSTLVFPKPEGGIVSVVYPLTFEPGAPSPTAGASSPAPPPPPAPRAPAPPPAAPKKQP